jgi:DNA-binding CsgD family transcriptional regulator
VNRPVHSRLTRREAQVLSELLRGMTTRQIATQYGIGNQTVKNYVTIIYEKLGIRGRSQLSEWCVSLDAAVDRGDSLDM